MAVTARAIERVAALSPAQRAGIRVIRVRLDGCRAVASIGQSGRGLTYPGEDVTAWADREDVPPAVSVTLWSAWPDIVVDIDATTSIGGQLAEVLHSGLVGPGCVERLQEAGDSPPRWRLICDGIDHAETSSQVSV